MPLLALPNEVLEFIVLESIPENFESLSLSCKSLYSVCEPHFQRHNQLRHQFRHFKYAAELSTSPHGICSAIELLCRIALEPIVARYIRKGDFENDGAFPVGRETIEPWTMCKGAGAVSGLFENSPYLREAGLNWSQYYNKMDEELTEVFYSQFATTFLLTLLPNLHTLILPARWYLHEITAGLFASIVINADGQTRGPQARGSSLAKVETFLTMTNLGEFADFDLDRHSMVFALPSMRHFRGTGCMAAQDLGMADGVAHVSGLLRPPPRFGARLESLHLETCWIDPGSLSQLLRRTPHLKTLRYSYRNLPRYRSKRWDPCALLNTVARDVGKHLEELSVTTPPLTELADFVPGKACLRNFERLRLLELSVDLVCLTMANGGSARTYSRCKGDGDVNGEINGDISGDVDGHVNGSVRGHVKGDVNGAICGIINGDVQGDIYGNVNGTIDGNVIGDVNGDINGTITGNVGGDVNGSVNGVITGSVEGIVMGRINGSVRGKVRGDDKRQARDLTLSKMNSSLFAELIPPTVTGLALVATTMDQHADALAALLRNFDAVKPHLAPALTKLCVTEPPRGGKPSKYRSVWESLSEQATKVGAKLSPTKQAGTSSSSSRTVFDWYGL